MQITVKLDNGEIIESDYHTRAAIMAEGNFTDAEFDEIIDGMRALIGNVKGLSSFKMTVDGEEININPSKILWVKLNMED